MSTRPIPDPDWRDAYADAPKCSLCGGSLHETESLASGVCLSCRFALEIPHAPQIAVGGNAEGQVPGPTRDEPCADAGAAQGGGELLPVYVTLEPVTYIEENKRSQPSPWGELHAYTPPIRCSECNEPWHQGPCSSPEISPVPVKTRAELLSAQEAGFARITELLEIHSRKFAALLAAAESINRHCPVAVSNTCGVLHTVTLSGAQILALRAAIENAK